VSDSTTGLPHAAQAAAEDSVGQAQAVAASLPLSEGARLADAVLVKRRLPNEITNPHEAEETNGRTRHNHNDRGSGREVLPASL
jgi:hypothetical protein